MLVSHLVGYDNSQPLISHTAITCSFEKDSVNQLTTLSLSLVRLLLVVAHDGLSSTEECLL